VDFDPANLSSKIPKTGSIKGNLSSVCPPAHFAVWPVLFEKSNFCQFLPPWRGIDGFSPSPQWKNRSSNRAEPNYSQIFVGTRPAVKTAVFRHFFSSVYRLWCHESFSGVWIKRRCQGFSFGSFSRA